MQTSLVSFDLVRQLVIVLNLRYHSVLINGLLSVLLRLSSKLFRLLFSLGLGHILLFVSMSAPQDILELRLLLLKLLKLLVHLLLGL